MAYTNSWDETSPAGTAAANTVDTIIQSLKVDIRERLNQVMSDFDDDAIDPKRIKISSGVIASRPTSNQKTGELYFATDEVKAYIWDGSGWIELPGSGSGGGFTLGDQTVKVGALANRPSPPDSTNGQLFWASDFDELYLSEGGSWILVSAASNISIQQWNYDDSLGAGSKGTDLGSKTRRITTVTVTGMTTDSSGIVQLDFDEVGVSLAPDFDEIIIAHYNTTLVGTIAIVARDVGNKTMDFEFRDYSGATINSSSVGSMRLVILADY